MDAAEFACNPHRFDGLDDKWFWIDEYQVPSKICWPDQNAMEVYRAKYETGMTFTQMEKHFEVSKPTLQKAIKVAKKSLSTSAETATD